MKPYVLKKSKVFKAYIILSLLGLFGHWNFTVLHGQNSVLDFSIKQINSQQQKLSNRKSASDIIQESGYLLDRYLRETAQAYYVMGLYKEALTTSNSIHDEEQISLCLLYYIDNAHSLTVMQQEQINRHIKNKVNQLTDKIRKNDILLALLLNQLEERKKQNVYSLLEQYKRNLLDIQSNDEERYSFALEHSLKLVIPLKRNGFDKTSGQLLKQVEDYFIKQYSLELLPPLLDTYLQLEDKKSILNCVTTVTNKIDPPSAYLPLIEFLIAVEEYSSADKLMIELIDYYCGSTGQRKSFLDFAGFLNINKISENSFLISRMAHNKKIIDVFRKYLTPISERTIEDVKNYGILSIIPILKFLVQSGYWEMAAGFARAIDDRSIEKNTCIDYYRYYLGLVLHHSCRNTMVHRLAIKIAQPHLAVDLLLKNADQYAERKNSNAFKSTMEKAQSIAIDNKSQQFPFGNIKDVARKWLRYGFVEKAVKLIQHSTDKIEKEQLMFAVAQEYLFLHKSKKTRQILNMISAPGYKARLLSKISAFRIINGDKTKGITGFKKAIKLLIEHRQPHLSLVLDDYTSAVKLNRMKRTIFQ